MDDYISKPIKLEILVSVIEKVGASIKGKSLSMHSSSTPLILVHFTKKSASGAEENDNAKIKCTSSN